MKIVSVGGALQRERGRGTVIEPYLLSVVGCGIIHLEVDEL